MTNHSPTWSERDLGQKLSITLLGLISAIFVAAMFVMGVDKLLAGNSLIERLYGVTLVAVAISFCFRAIRWWRARHAR